MKRWMQKAVFLLVLFSCAGIVIPKHTKAAALPEEEKKEFKNYLREGAEKFSFISEDVWFDSFMLYDMDYDGKKDLVIQAYEDKTPDVVGIIVVNFCEDGKNHISSLIGERLEAVSSKGILSVKEEHFEEMGEKFFMTQHIYSLNEERTWKRMIYKCNVLVPSEEDFRDKMTGVVFKNAKSVQRTAYYSVWGNGGEESSEAISRYVFGKRYQNYGFTKKAKLYKITSENIRKILG